MKFFLGGHDLEMETIADLVADRLGPEAVVDADLSWGAKASAYADAIAETLRLGEMPVLVELADDLPRDLDRSRLIVVDHHGPLAGAGQPSSLAQTFALLDLPPERWTRHMALVDANDVGHIAGLRAMDASPEEIRSIRDADRRAQGVTPQDEAAARSAITTAKTRGVLTVLRLEVCRTSPATDFMEPEYGGPGVENLLVLTPHTANFFGSGQVVSTLRDETGAWWGGALPQRGFWGCPIANAFEGEALIARIEAELTPSS